MLFGIENILIVWLGASLVLDGNFTIGVLIAFIAYKAQFGTRVTALIDKYFEVKMLQLQGERLADILLTEPETLEPRLAAAGDPHDSTIELCGLRYRYGEQDPYVLDGVDLRIAAGESIAIVGPSGCGKSTLINVMLGVLPPTEGNVIIGGVQLRHLGVDMLRSMVGTVMQDDVLFAGSIADNICFFDSQADQKWIEQCARMAAIHPDIMAMPMRYNSLVGNMGTVLSGGQKQRILLARALYKRPKILFLDEATSHLDVECEYKVNSAVKALRITRVIVAHRPETIAMASRVVSLIDGRCTEGPYVSAATSNPIPVQRGIRVSISGAGSD
jgi:ATP-binding cassette subfamily B protein RaxB